MQWLDAKNVMSLISGYDLVLDGLDNFETRYLVSDARFLAAPPITAALGISDVADRRSARAREERADGEFNPTYRCHFNRRHGHCARLRRSRRHGRARWHPGTTMALEAIRIDLLGLARAWSVGC